MGQVRISTLIIAQKIIFCSPKYSKYVTKTNQSANLANPWNATGGLG